MSRHHNKLILAVLVCLAVMAAPVFAQQVIYVDDDAVGGNGTSWQAAYTYLQDALAVAQAGDEIRVGTQVF